MGCVQESMTNQEDCIELALTCADVCTTLREGLDGKRLEDLHSSVYKAVGRLET